MKSVIYPNRRDRQGTIPPLVAIRGIVVLLVLIASTALLASPPSHRPDTLFTFSFVKAPLKDIFRQIEKNSEFTIAFKSGINLYERISLRVNKEPIEKILTLILKEQDLSFKINDKQITIYKEEPAPFRELIHTIKGTITDTFGQPITGITITVKGGANGTATDSKGNFELQVDGTVTLIITNTDGNTREITAHPDDKLRITL